MSAPSRPPRPPDRREFLAPPVQKPFLRSPEFQRILWFATLLLFVGAFATYTALRDRASSDASRTAAPTQPAVAVRTAEEAERRRAELPTFFEGALTDSENGTDFADTDGYRRLVRTVAAYTPEGVRERIHLDIDPAVIAQQPDAYRGEFVRVRGVVGAMTTEKLRVPVLGIHDVYRGFLGEGDGRPRAVFDLVGYPPEFAMRRDAVDVEGVMYRTVRYETRTGDFLELPYIVARNMAKVEHLPAHHSAFLREHTLGIVIGIGLAILGARLLMYWLQRKKKRSGSPPRTRPPDFRDLFEEKLREVRSSGQPPTTPPA